MRPVAFASALLVAVSALAETVPRTVNVVVTDSKGERVRGLTAADFQIFENGRPKDIHKFAESTAETAGQVRRSIVVLFDSSTLSLPSRKKAVAALRGAMPALVRPQDRIAIATITPTGRMLEAVPWTNDLAAITKALDVVERESLAPSAMSSDRAENEIRQLVSDDRAGGTNSQITFESLMSPARQYAEFVSMQTRHILDGILDAVDYCGTSPGGKVVLLVGAGLPSRPGSGLFQLLENLRGQALSGLTGAGVRRGAAAASPMGEVSRYDMTPTIRKAGAAAFGRGVVLYAIDPEGWRSESGVERTEARDVGMEGASAIEKLAGFQLLANATGGAAILGGSASEAVAQVTSDLQSHYALTIDVDAANNRNVPKIEVKSKPGYRTRVWFEGGAATRESLVEETVVANHRGEIASNELQIAVAADPAVTDGNDRRVKVKVFIPVKSLTLTADGADVVGGFDVYVSTGDASGNASAVNRQKYQIRWPAAQFEQMKEKTIGYAVDVVLIPGRTQVSIGVVDQQSQHTGFARAVIGG